MVKGDKIESRDGNAGLSDYRVVIAETENPWMNNL
jgi:hypothetical protein